MQIYPIFLLTLEFPSTARFECPQSTVTSAPYLCQLLLVLLCLHSGPLEAAETLGAGGEALPWTSALETSQFVSVSADSIWMWSVQANTNLAVGLLERGGFAASRRGDELTLDPVGAAALVDGDGATAFDPDDFDDVERLSPVYIDLGGTFSVNRIRIYPRLDKSHERRFLQEFIVGTSSVGVLDVGTVFISQLFGYQAPNPNTEPVLDRLFSTSVPVRTLIIDPLTEREWEIAEIEVFGDGTVPVGEYVSVPLAARRSTPVWGRVRYNGQDLGQAAFVVQTRTGPDANPMLYYMLKGDELIPVSKVAWEGALPGLQGPVLPNPEWSAWETVSEGIVRSPSINRFLQFRVRLPEAGVALRSLSFEYTFPPIARSMEAEIAPTQAIAGEATEFTVSMLVHLSKRGSALRQDTGFRQLEILTDAEIGQVKRVLVDDEEVFTTTTYDPERGLSINLWRRVMQDGSFVQVVFDAAVYRDRTRFEVRALDRRVNGEGQLEVAYQLADEADVDETASGGTLVVSLDTGGEQLPVLGEVRPSAGVITPNGDGVNDQVDIAVDLLKLVGPAAISLDIHGLDGLHVRSAFRAQADNGSYRMSWNGADDLGRLVSTGLYLYEVRVETDAGTERRLGTIGVAY